MEDNQQLQRRIEALEKWKSERENQQIAFPIDVQSIDILNKYFVHYLSTISYQAGVGGNTFVSYLAQQNGLLFELNPPSLVSYTVNVATNYLTTNQFSGNLKFFDNQEVTLFTDGIAPDPLSAGLGTVYHVINSDGYTFQLSASSGGAAIDITDNGSGRQFINYNI
jgi:hypothetical protein